MADMICNLLNLPDYHTLEAKLESEGIHVFRPLPGDMTRVLKWVNENSGESGLSECQIAFSHMPVSAYIAEKNGQVIGYACHSIIAPDFFGPTRVDSSYQHKGIGTLLLLKTLYSMRNIGFVYAIIGCIGPAEFYEKTVGAKIINDDLGIYENSLKIKRKNLV